MGQCELNIVFARQFPILKICLNAYLHAPLALLTVVLSKQVKQKTT